MSYTPWAREGFMRPPGSPEELERRRRRAMALLAEGHGPTEVARVVGVDRRSVRRWKSAHRRHGERALRARPASGRPPKLLARQVAQVERPLLRGGRRRPGSPPSCGPVPGLRRSSAVALESPIMSIM